MKKLIQGIADFRHKVLPGYRETFARLAIEQKPDVLFVACSDSRVVPNLFASTDPGDLFVVRNVGNLIPPCGSGGISESDESEPAAIEFALERLKVSDVVVCGHSECGAMHAIWDGRKKVPLPHLKSWLRHGERAAEELRAGGTFNPALSRPNELSQLNVLRQLDHLRSYDVVQERVRTGGLRLHGWWFDIGHADVYAYEEESRKFVLIDDAEARRILKQLEASAPA